MEFWIHGARAKSIDQVKSYLDGDAHDRSKVVVFVRDDTAEYPTGQFYNLIDDPNDDGMRLHRRLPAAVRVWVINQLGA